MATETNFPALGKIIPFTGASYGWQDETNIYASDNVYASIKQTYPGSVTVLDKEVSLINDVGGIFGQDKSSAVQWPTTEAVEVYGGSSDMWNLVSGSTITPAIINDADFGCQIALYYNSLGTPYSNRLKASAFGFSIPTGATILGIELSIERWKDYQARANTTVPKVDSFEMTITYSVSTAHVKIVTETVTMTASIVKDIGRELNENVTIVDAVFKDISRTLEDSVTVLDTLVRKIINRGKAFVTLLGTKLEKIITPTENIDKNVLPTHRQNTNVLKLKQEDKHILGTKKQDNNIL